jgi:hypothetical protein
VLAFEVLRRSSGQVRASGPFILGLDFGSVLALAEAMGALSPLLVDVLPVYEALIVNHAAQSQASESDSNEHERPQRHDPSRD